MPICCVPGCSTCSKTAYKYPKFKGVHPVIGTRLFTIRPNQRKAWSKLLKIEDPNPNWSNMRVCSRHFTMKQYYRDKIERFLKSGKLLSRGDTILLPNAVPDKCLPGDADEEQNLEEVDDVFDRKIYRARKASIKKCIMEKSVESSPSYSEDSHECDPAEGGGAADNLALNEACPTLAMEIELDSCPINSVSRQESAGDSLENISAPEVPGSHHEGKGLIDVEQQGASSKLSQNSASDVQQGSSIVNLLSSVGLGTSRPYLRLCKMNYEEDLPEHAQRYEGFFNKYPCEVVTRKFLTDTKQTAIKADLWIQNMERQVLDLEMELMKSKSREETLANEVKRREETYEKAMENLRSVFSKSQLDRLIENKNTPWSDDDSKKALTLLEASSQAYDMIKRVYKIPMPCESALRNQVASMK
ncbi:uncharacterized protein LOC135948586 [Cloeon dipterum]|uniref:uncharacterized protein LOC135948586 n=1 Tax=Cloeon dipterum TaxID=197152 RepID=UPI00321F61F4